MVASRKVEGSKILKNQPVFRRFSSNVFDVLVCFLFGLSVKDTQCRAKVFKRDVIMAVLDDVRSKRFELMLSFFGASRRRGLRLRKFR
ncbi:MAG: hypothetical protein ABIG84_07770 [archaeon]